MSDLSFISRKATVIYCSSTEHNINRHPFILPRCEHFGELPRGGQQLCAVFAPQLRICVQHAVDRKRSAVATPQPVRMLSIRRFVRCRDAALGKVGALPEMDRVLQSGHPVGLLHRQDRRRQHVAEQGERPQAGQPLAFVEAYPAGQRGGVHLYKYRMRTFYV